MTLNQLKQWRKRFGWAFIALFAYFVIRNLTDNRVTSHSTDSPRLDPLPELVVTEGPVDSEPEDQISSSENSGAAKPCNPCNPEAAKACNPSNPDAAKVDNPCNPCAAKDNNSGQVTTLPTASNTDNDGLDLSTSSKPARWEPMAHIASLLASMTTLLGFISTTLLAWRKEKRETESHNQEIEEKNIEIAKLRNELAQSDNS